MHDFSSFKVFGVRVDKVTLDQSVEFITKCLKDKSKKKFYIVTPNVEFIMAAQHNQDFLRVLNNADLSVPDSARFSWTNWENLQKNPLKRILFSPWAILPKKFIPGETIPVTTGVDLLERVCQEANQKGSSIGFLGGFHGVAKQTADQLQAKYPHLKITYIQESIAVDQDGNVKDSSPDYLPHSPLDVLFVGLGQVKQELWIAKNLPTFPTKIAVGVGGAFDYLSGRVSRAPKIWQEMGLEWLYRLVLQPWRIKRQLALASYVFKVVLGEK